MNKKDHEKLEVGVGGGGLITRAYNSGGEREKKKLHCDHASNFQCQVKTIIHHRFLSEKLISPPPPKLIHNYKNT